jgi:hypothetical protein
MNTPSTIPPLLHHQNRSSPGSMTPHRQPNVPPVNQGQPNYNQNQGNFQQPPAAHGSWFPPSIAAPQASAPAQPPAIPQPPAEQWDDTYLHVLGTQDRGQLRDLLARSNPEVVMPANGQGPLSQAVVLTLLHRLAAAVGETSPADESFKSLLWWLQRTAATLKHNDPVISPYLDRVLPSVQQMLSTTKQRFALLPGGQPLIDTTRTISEIQDTLTRRPM